MSFEHVAEIGDTDDAAQIRLPIRNTLSIDEARDLANRLYLFIDKREVRDFQIISNQERGFVSLVLVDIEGPYEYMRVYVQGTVELLSRNQRKNLFNSISSWISTSAESEIVLHPFREFTRLQLSSKEILSRIPKEQYKADCKGGHSKDYILRNYSFILDVFAEYNHDLQQLEKLEAMLYEQKKKFQEFFEQDQHFFSSVLEAQRNVLRQVLEYQRFSAIGIPLALDAVRADKVQVLLNGANTEVKISGDNAQLIAKVAAMHYLVVTIPLDGKSHSLHAQLTGFRCLRQDMWFWIVPETQDATIRGCSANLPGCLLGDRKLREDNAIAVIEQQLYMQSPSESDKQ